MGVIITSAICSIVAIFCFSTAYRQHKEKGFVFNNAWLYASQRERENMDIRLKKRAYLVSRNVFSLLGVLFSLLAATILFETSWLQYLGYSLMGALAILLCIYAIVQYVTGERLCTSIEAEKKSNPV